MSPLRLAQEVYFLKGLYDLMDLHNLSQIETEYNFCRAESDRDFSEEEIKELLAYPAYHQPQIEASDNKCECERCVAEEMMNDDNAKFRGVWEMFNFFRDENSAHEKEDDDARTSSSSSHREERDDDDIVREDIDSNVSSVHHVPVLRDD